MTNKPDRRVLRRRGGGSKRANLWDRVRVHGLTDHFEHSTPSLPIEANVQPSEHSERVGAPDSELIA